MGTSTDSPGENRSSDNQPNAARHAEFAGDETGRIAGNITPTIAPSKLPRHEQSPGIQAENPGPPATTHEDEGWVREEEGSLLAHEREGVPEDNIPESIPESTAHTRPKA